VGLLFGILYLIGPVIWMIPPMIYRVLNPNLTGLQDEGAYLMMCKEVLPAGMLGLMLISLVFATNSSVQGVLNISAGVITNDLYRNKFPDSSEIQLMVIAKIASILFGFVTILIAMLVPYMGGAKEVVLSIAALTGAPLYLPLVWSLFSKKQTGKIALATTLTSLILTLSTKFLVPVFTDYSLSRGGEIMAGVGLPVILIIFSEIYLQIKNVGDTSHSRKELVFSRKRVDFSEKNGSASGNKQGLRMVAIGIIATGLILGFLGIAASSGRFYILSMTGILLLIGWRILSGTHFKNT
jgi:solute:Na+ symporter, SSS family